jgi:hypothetical protein
MTCTHIWDVPPQQKGVIPLATCLECGDERLMSNSLPIDHKGSIGIVSRKLVAKSRADSLAREKLAKAAIGRTEQEHHDLD